MVKGDEGGWCLCHYVLWEWDRCGVGDVQGLLLHKPFGSVWGSANVDGFNKNV